MEKIKITTSKTVEWLKDISTKSGLKKALSYEDISLWWYFEPPLCFLVENYIKNKKYGSGTLKKDTPKTILKFAKYWFTSKVITRFVLGMLMVKRIKNTQAENSGTYIILALSYTNYWKKYPIPQQQKREVGGDTMLSCIITALKTKNFNVVALDETSEFFIGFKTMIEKHVQERGLWRPVEVYLTFDIIKKAFKASRRYKEEWNKLKNNKEFIDSLNIDYDSIQLPKLLKDYFEKLFKYRTFLPILYIELMKRAIEVEKPNLILMTCGSCLSGRAAVIAGKLKRVPTMEIQHGVIHPTHFDYILSKDENSLEGGVKSPYCPLPDKTAVYGNYHKELLTKMSVYPGNSVVVTGQPRYDFLDYADKIYSKEKFLKRYSINPNHKIILWATAFHGQDDEGNIKDFKAVFKMIQSIKNTTLVIKPHPRDEKRHIKTIKHYLSDYKISAVVSPGSSDTYEQLFFCDLMITRVSTTAMEAVALNKPVIVLDLNYKSDIIGYVEEGVALGVYKADDLKPTIEKLLRDDSELAKNRERYIEKYLYKIDGKATERVINLIEEMIKESKRNRNEKYV
jgi:glycosyltransferase involved in cell wall biosynthesis